MDGGLTAIGGFLFQTVGALSLKASPFQEYRDAPQNTADLEAVFGFAKEGELHYEAEDQDAAIREALHKELPGYILIQFKYCSLPKLDPITKYDLQQIIIRLEASAEQASLHGHQVTGYSLLTNRPLNNAAWQLVKSTSIPFYIADSLPERYWEERLRQFARCFSCTDTEVAHGIRQGIGDLLQRVTHRRFFGEPVITREMLIEAFTGWPATHALTPDIVAEKSRQQLSRLFSQPFHLGRLPFVLRPSIQKQLSDLVEQHAFIVLSGTGGNGKTTALWQWLEDCFISRLPQQRGLYYYLDSADKVQRDFLAVRFCRWAQVPTTHHWTVVNTPEQVIDRLEIARNASTRLPAEHHLIFILALDAVDEAFQQPDKDALKELLMWFWEQETQLNVFPRATLIITCRETKELARKWLRIIDPYEKEPKPFRDIEIEVKEFSPDELVVAARQCLPAFADRFEKARQAFKAPSPLVESKQINTIFPAPSSLLLGALDGEGEAFSVFQAENASLQAVHEEVFQALCHPTLWQCLLRIDTLQLPSVLDGETNALGLLADLFLRWFCAKMQARGNARELSEVIGVLVKLALQSNTDGVSRYQDWITCTSKTPYMTPSQADSFYKEALSAGLIVRETDGWWRWRHPFIGRYLIQSPLYEEG